MAIQEIIEKSVSVSIDHSFREFVLNGMGSTAVLGGELGFRRFLKVGERTARVQVDGHDLVEMCRGKRMKKGGRTLFAVRGGGLLTPGEVPTRG